MFVGRLEELAQLNEFKKRKIVDKGTQDAISVSCILKGNDLVISALYTSLAILFLSRICCDYLEDHWASLICQESPWYRKTY